MVSLEEVTAQLRAPGARDGGLLM